MANNDTSVGIPVMSIDEKAIKIKKLVDNLQKNCNIDDEQLIITKELFEDNDLSLLKNILLKDYKLKNGHSQSDNDKLIQELFNHCVTKCVKEEKLEFMIVVAVLLPDIVTKSYKSTVTNLMMQLSYVRIPSKWSNEKESTFHSIRENLWGYKFPDHESPLSQFDKFEKVPPHSATLCYVPLPGLCTYPKCSSTFNTLIPCHLSPFTKFIISNSSEVLDTSKASSKIYESASFQAIIKFKWHAFARWRFFGNLFVYLSHFILYAAALSKTNQTTEGKWLMIASMILEAILIFCKIKYIIICVANGIGVFAQPTHYKLLAHVLPILTGFLFLHNDTSEKFILLQAFSVLQLWIGFIGYLIVFKNVGIFIIVIMHICRKILWLLVLIAIVLFAFSHSAVLYVLGFKGVNEEYKNDSSEAFRLFYVEFMVIWDNFLNNYDSDYNSYPVDISRIVLTFFTSIIMMNLLIAIVNNVYEEVLQRAHAEWTIVRAKCIVYIELLFMMPSERQNRDYFPLTITYEAFTEDVDKWPKKLKDGNIPIPWEEEITLTEEKLRQFLSKFIELQR